MHPDNISRTCTQLVKKFEGLHKVKEDGLVHSYRCPAGKWTIGYGVTKGVRSGMKQTKAEAEKALLDELLEHSKAIYRHVNVPLTQHQFDSLTSFVYNLGEPNFKSSTLLKKLNKGLYDEVPEQLMRWNKARVDGKLTPLRGLTRRRSAEAALFAMDTKLADEGGDTMVQKPQATAPKSLAKSKTMAGVGIAGTATMLGEMSSQVEGLVAYSSSLKTLFLILAIGGIALAAYARWKDNKEGVH
jgi:lysozyme|tara:strand:+ start:75 stop:803 length:729 start_codon:yes stop_codon:yes gene_type:complete